MTDHSAAETAKARLNHPYFGARAILTTMHGKEAVIAPALHAAIGLKVETTKGVDTDQLGTFAGAIPRSGSMRDVAIHKARLGMAATGCRLALASEGSFGPHPAFPLIPAGREIMVLVDDERGIIISESLVTEETNYGRWLATSIGDVDEAISRARFPEHAMVVTCNRLDSPWWRLHADIRPLLRGIQRSDDLDRAIKRCAQMSEDGQALVQTDMRAHLNPERMRSLLNLARKLGDRLLRLCPRCAAPGFGSVDHVTGLPCGGCGAPTDIIAQTVLGCAGCDFREAQPVVAAGSRAPPADCPACNP